MRKILRLGARRVRGLYVCAHSLALHCLFLYQVVYSLWLFAWRQEWSSLTAGADVYIRKQLIRGQMSAQIQLTFSLMALALQPTTMEPLSRKTLSISAACVSAALSKPSWRLIDNSLIERAQEFIVCLS